MQPQSLEAAAGLKTRPILALNDELVHTTYIQYASMLLSLIFNLCTTHCWLAGRPGSNINVHYSLALCISSYLLCYMYYIVL